MPMEENQKRKVDLVAPDVEHLLRCFDRNGMRNPVASTKQLLDTFEKLWAILTPLAPIPTNEEAKGIWIRIPRGTIEDYSKCYYTFEEARDVEDVNSYEEYENYWKCDFPGETIWYRLLAAKSVNKDGSLRYYGVNLSSKTIITALTELRCREEESFYMEETAIKLCEMLLPAIQESIDLLVAGKYNEMVEAELPYQFRTGIIKRSELNEYCPSNRASNYDGLSEETVQKFRELINSGANDATHIDRIHRFTANDFFKACKIGYEAIGKDCSGYSLSELYQHYSDGRDEGLTGMGFGLNEGHGIDFSSPEEWDAWYNGNRCGGHPWEVVPGGNSTHMELYVKNDKQHLDYSLRIGDITQEEYDREIVHAGYYFEIDGIQRQYEAVSFYIALIEAGLPVIIHEAEELLARFDATDYVGIVPHEQITRYCESLFPTKYGRIIDFAHVYKDEDPWFEKITWLPSQQAHLASEIKEKTK